MPAMERLDAYSSSGGAYGAIARGAVRFLQFVLALTVAGLYGVDLHAAHSAHVPADNRWVFAEVTAGLAAVTCLVYAVPVIKSYWAWGWDLVLFILYTALFGTFGKIYIHAHPTPEQGGQIRMKHAVWVDLINMLLWFFTGVYGLVVWFARRGGRRKLIGPAYG